MPPTIPADINEIRRTLRAFLPTPSSFQLRQQKRDGSCLQAVDQIEVGGFENLRGPD